ncbi:MAG: CapA family protein [Candidatus Colwellbacteria bacterium]
MYTPIERRLTWVILGVLIMFYGWLLTFAGELTILTIRANRSGNIAAELQQRVGSSASAEQRATMLFVGDIMLSRSVGEYMETIGDYRFPFTQVAQVLKDVDVAFGNLESPISSRGANQGSIYSFRADPRVVEGLTFAGFDVLSLANNHIWDWGKDALLDTVSTLKGEGMSPVGAGANHTQANQPVILEFKETKVAFLAYTNLLPQSLEASSESPGLSEFDLDKIKDAVVYLKDEVDLIVVSLHWGEEYETSSNAEQEEIAHALIDSGVDLVVGHHSHVVQELERYGNGWVAYSLGNFVFDQTFSKETMRGAALWVQLEGGDIRDAKLLPVYISPEFQPAIDASLL